MAKQKWSTKMRRKRKRMVSKMKITFWRIVGAVGVFALVISFFGKVGIKVANVLTDLDSGIWNGIIFVGGAVITFIVLMYLWGLWQQRQLVDSEIDLNKAEAEVKRGKAEREYSGADKNRTEADNSRVKANAEVKVIEVDADIKRQEVIGKQIENAKAAVEVELSKKLLGRVDDLIDKAVSSDVPYSLNAPGSFTLTAKVPKTITNNPVPLLGQGEVDQGVEYLKMVKEQLAHRDSTRLIVFGEQGSGKTTAAKWTLSEAAKLYSKIPGAEVYLLDPHAPEGLSMPEGCGKNIMVIGGGMDYGAIRKFLDLLKGEVKERYAKGCAIESNQAPPPKFIVCEEWSGLLASFRVQEQRTGMVWWDEEDQKMLFMDARKAAIGYFLIVHSRNVGSIGVTGNQDLLNGVDSYLYLGRNVVGSSITYHSRVYTQLNEFKTSSPDKLLKYGNDVIMPGPYTGSLKVATEKAKTEVESRMLALPAPKGWVIDLNANQVNNESKPVKNKSNQSISKEDLSTIIKEVHKEGGGKLNQSEVLRRAGIQNKKRVRQLANELGLL